MQDINTSHMAGEYLVAGELSRRGYPVVITPGKAKAVDIVTYEGPKVRVDAKAIRGKGNWPLKEDSVRDDLWYVFVFLQTPTNYDKPPEYFIASGKEINQQSLIEHWGTRQGIRYKTLDTSKYKGRWDKLPKAHQQKKSRSVRY